MATYVHILEGTSVKIDRGITRDDIRITIDNYEGDRCIFLVAPKKGLQLNPVSIGEVLIPAKENSSNEA